VVWSLLAEVRRVDYLYSLYDALVSINVPNHKARAVVDAMERDMATTLATKSDLQLLQQEARSELQLLRQDIRAELQLLRQETKSGIALLERDMTVRLGLMLFAAVGLLFAALQLFP
jgi:predicted lipoprotein